MSHPVTGPFCCCTRAHLSKEATSCERLVLSRTLVSSDTTGVVVNPDQDLSWRGLLHQAVVLSAFVHSLGDDIFPKIVIQDATRTSLQRLLDQVVLSAPFYEGLRIREVRSASGRIMVSLVRIGTRRSPRVWLVTSSVVCGASSSAAECTFGMTVVICEVAHICSITSVKGPCW